MKVIICDEKRLIKSAKQSYADLGVKMDDLAVISIRDCGEGVVPLPNKPKWLLPLEFDDVVPGDGEGVPISDEQAERIARFVYSCRNEAKLVVCQCTFGQSRSAAVAAAILEHFGRRGIKIFADEKYYPNKNVFRKVLKALRNAGNFVILDVETSGFDPGRDRIIKVTAVKIRNFTRVDEFSSLVCCEEPLSSKVESLTGITSEMLAVSPPLSQVIDALKEFCVGYSLVAEGAPFVEKFLSGYGFTSIRDEGRDFCRQFGDE